MSSRLRVTAVAVAVLLGASACSTGGVLGASSASCAQPTTTAAAHAVAPGSPLDVSVQGLLQDCADTGPEPVEAPPVENARVVWAQGGVERELALVEPDERGDISVTVTVPEDATAGAATVTIGTSEPAEVTVEPGGDVQGASAALCALPITIAGTSVIAPGDPLKISVEGLLQDCWDTGQGIAPAVDEAVVVWEQGGAQRELMVVEPDDQGDVVVTVTVPEDAAAGEATVTIGYSAPAEVTVGS